MAYVAVDEDKTEWIFDEFEPIRDGVGWTSHNYSDYIELPKGSIKKLIGRELTWEDEPVELKEQA